MKTNIRYSYGKIIQEFDVKDLPKDVLINIVLHVMNKANCYLTREQADKINAWVPYREE